MKILKISGLILLVLLMLACVVLVSIGGGFGTREASLRYAGSDVLLFAHRGTPFHPENSFEGFEAAKRLGFKAIEMDIRFSRDGIPLVIHDEDGTRLLGVNRLINEMNAAELTDKNIRMDDKPSLSFVMTLDEALTKFGNAFVIYLDVKLHDLAAARKMIEAIRKHDLATSTVVANSNILFTACIEYSDPEINTVLEGFTPGKEWLFRILPKNFKPDFLASFSEDVNEEHLAWLTRNGLMSRRIAYGVTKDDLQHIIDSGIKKVILDYDSSLSEIVSRYR